MSQTLACAERAAGGPGAACDIARGCERVFVDCPSCETRSFAYLLDKVHPGMTFGEVSAQAIADGWAELSHHSGVLKKCEEHAS